MSKSIFLFLLLWMTFINSACSQSNSGFQTLTLESGNQNRPFLLYIPSTVAEDSVPLVFSFHGSGGVPQNQVDISNFSALADKHGFAVVFPAGAFTNSVSERSWNANIEAGVNDVQFVRDIIEDVAARINLDRNRIYTSGYSGGARMSSRLACELSDVIAAAAPVAGLQYPDDCVPKLAVPIIAFHALDDQVNQYSVSENSRAYWRMGVETALDKWRQANGCSLRNSYQSLSPEITLFQWDDCDNGAQINFYQLTSGDHTWPGANQPGANQDIDASALIWEFFSSHHR